MADPTTEVAAVAMAGRAALRRATGDVHARLHDLPGFQALASGTIGRPAYVDLLRRLLGFHRMIERRLDDAPDVPGIDLAQRRRSALIQDDLAALGADTAAAAGRAPGLPSLTSSARAVGCLYVTEGSTLGGRLLARRLDHLLPADGVTGRAFLMGYGSRHAAMWQACCSAVEACAADPADRAEMIDTAVATFEAFEAWFGVAAAAGDGLAVGRSS